MGFIRVLLSPSEFLLSPSEFLIFFGFRWDWWGSENCSKSAHYDLPGTPAIFGSAGPRRHQKVRLQAQSKAEDSARQIERRMCEVNLLSMELAKSERDSAERDSALAGRRRLIDEL